MKHIWKPFIAALTLLLLAQTSLYSQTLALPGDGKDFFVGYMLPSYNKVGAPQTDGFYGAYVLISTYTDNHVTVSYFDKTTGVESPGARYFIPERTGIPVQLSIQNMLMADSGDVPEFGACHIKADRAINVEFFSTGACSGGSFLPITTAGLGKRYVIASYGNNNGELGLLGSYLGPKELEISHGFFEIIAPFDGTQVTINPTSTTMGGHRGMRTGRNATQKESPYSVTLRRGQCYLVKSAGDERDDDISGSIVESNKPIAVIAGQENAAIGGVSNRSLEGRDFMVEQMYPWDMWDTTGYVMIPLKDSQPADPQNYEGVGENYRVFTWDTVGSRVQLYDGCLGAPIDMPAGRMGSPATERFEVTCPVDFEATNGRKFSVMMYDNRNFATAAPYPAPSMINVIPISRWRTSFLWYVPANKFETLQSYYVDVLAPTGDFDGITGIIASFNGGTKKPIKQVIALDGQFKKIPNHPELGGIRFKLYPGSYYATGPHPFMVYNYGFRALDPNFDLGDFDGDDFFFSYGLPVGLKLGGVPHIRITVDTFCSYWNVCVHDSTLGLSNQGIKSVTLLDDSSGDFVKPGKVYRNTRLDDSLDPDNTREINFTGDDSDICFKVLVNKPIKSGYAPLFVVDDQGGAVLLELNYTPPIVRLLPDSGRYLLIPLGKDTCSSFVFLNQGTTKTIKGSKGQDSVIHIGKTFRFTSDNLKLNNPAFKVTNTVPALPVDLNPGDSLTITACFTPKDSVTQRDTIELVNDCFGEPIDLIGKPAIPLIVAGNRDFGNVLVDSTKCDTVSIRNVGNAPFTLTTQWVLHNIVNFKFRDTNLLPMKLNPGQVVYLYFCYTPHAEQVDTTVQNWGTSLLEPYKHAIKDSSILRGAGVRSGFIWDRTVQEQTVTCDDSAIVRVHLLNNATKGSGSPSTHVTTVNFSGADASEFYILANQLHGGSGPFGDFDLNAGDSIWVDVVFKPSLAKPIPPKYDDRHADLVASGPSEKDQVIKFTGHVLYAAPDLAPTFNNYGTVALGLTNTRSFYLTNTGTAPLVVDKIYPITYPVINCDLQPGTVIQPGPTNGVIVKVDMALTTFVDTTVFLNVSYKTSCPNIIPETLHIASSYVNPTNTGHPFTPTFLNCRNLTDSIQAQNVGTTNLTLRKIDIINQNPPGAPQFAFTANGLQTLVVNKIYRPGTKLFYPVIYSPTIEGPVDDSVQCTWDSLDVTSGKVVKTLYSGNHLTGTGRLERDTVSPIQVSAQPYSTSTGATVAVPINLTRVLPADVDAKGMTFQITYRRDLLDYIPANTTYDGSLTPVGGQPVGVPDGNGNETVTFVLQSSTPITSLAPIATMHFRLMVAKDYYSTIAASHAVFWGQNPQDTLCYVINETKAAPFNPSDLCGDSTLRHYLYGGLPTKIIAISPNPSVEANTPVVTYEVRKAKVPLTIELYNALGEHVRTVEKDVPHEVGQYSLPLGVKNLPSGMYVLRITTPTSVESSQFVIQK